MKQGKNKRNNTQNLKEYIQQQKEESKRGVEEIRRKIWGRDCKKGMVKEKSLTTIMKFAIVMNIRAVANYIYI